MKAITIGDQLLTTQDVRQMTLEETKILITLVSRPDFTIPWDEGMVPQACGIARAHATVRGVEITDQNYLMIAAICDRPGTVVMYVAAMAALNAKLGHTATLTDLCEAFPVGFPTEEALTKIWDGQKVHDGNGPDNWLDRDEAWTTD